MDPCPKDGHEERQDRVRDRETHPEAQPEEEVSKSLLHGSLR